VDEAAETIAAHDRTLGIDWSQRRRIFGSSEIEPLVRTLAVVVLDIGLDHGLQMAAVDDHDPVETLASNGADPALGVGVRQSRQLHLMETVRPEPSE